MDAGSMVIALLTAAGAAAGPAALGGLPDATASTSRCIAAPDEERSGRARSDAEALAQRRTDVGLDAERDGGRDTGRDTGANTGTGSAALAEELALELADVVAGSDDPTSRRLAAALAAAGFEPSAGQAAGSRQQDTAASRSGEDEQAGRLDDRSDRLNDQLGDDQLRDDQLGGSRRDDSELDRDRLDDRLADRNGRAQGRLDDELGDDRLGNGQDDADQVGDDRLGRDQGNGQAACDGRADDAGDAEASGANRSSDLDDVLASRGSDAGSREPADSTADRGRSNDPVELDGSDIASVLERGERVGG